MSWYVVLQKGISSVKGKLVHTCSYSSPYQEPKITVLHRHDYASTVVVVVHTCSYSSRYQDPKIIVLHRNDSCAPTVDDVVKSNTPPYGVCSCPKRK